MSYDGIFIKMLHDNKIADSSKLIASDYLQNNLDFLKRMLSCQTVAISSDNDMPGINDGSINAASFIFQIEFTPKFEDLISVVTRKIIPNGSIFVAAVSYAWYRRLIWQMIFWYKRFILRKYVNIYENNPFYKIGPFQNIKLSILNKIFSANNCKLENIKTIHPTPGVILNLVIFRKTKLD